MRLFRIWITLLILLPVFAQAQPYTSIGGTFELSDKNGCAPFSVTVNVLFPSVCNGANPCAVDFERNGNFQTLVTSHTYTTPGTYWLRVLYQALVIDSIQVQVYNNIAPSFELYACNANQVQVNLTDTNYDEYILDFNDGTVTTVLSGSMTNHAFGSPGNKTISVRGRNLNSADNCNVSDQTFLAQPVLPPPFIDLLTVLNGTEIQLDFTGQPNVLYRLEISNNGAPFQFVRNLYNVSTTVVSSLQTDNRFYCFRIQTFDPCTGTSTPSNVICSADFDLTLQNNNNQLSWVTSNTGVTDYSLNRDAALLATVPAASTLFDDGTAVCNTNYCYQLIHNYANGSQSISLTKCGTAFSTDIPTTPANISAQVNANGVDLDWTQDPAFTTTGYSVLRGTSGGSFVTIGTAPAPLFSDNSYTTDGNFCYRIAYTDICGNVSSPSIDACPIRLTGNLLSDNTIDLSWSEYVGWENGVLEYTVEKFDQNGNLISSTSTGTTTIFTDAVEDPTNQIYTYEIFATANDGGVTQSISNSITIIKEPKLYYPTAFTPNGDNLNDKFTVIGQYVVEINMKIFNRWGEQLYGSRDINQGWDGTYQGKDVPEGTYAFVADITDFAGRQFNRSGSVVLLRKK